MAATYPLEVVEADRWLQIPASAALKGDALTAALQQQPWHPSVKSLVTFPQLLQWTLTSIGPSSSSEFVCLIISGNKSRPPLSIGHRTAGWIGLAPSGPRANASLLYKQARTTEPLP